MDIKPNTKDEDKISDNENDAAKNEKWYRSILIWIGKTTRITDWLIILCTLAIAIIGFFQWQTLKKTDQASRLRDRAFINFLNPTIFKYPRKSPIVGAVSIALINNGNMPARIVSLRCGWAHSKPIDKFIDPFPLAKWNGVNVARFIGPKETIKLQGTEIPIEMVNRAIKRKVNIFVLMEVKYFDGFDHINLRTTQKSRSWRFDDYGGTSWGYAGPHNCIDNDCYN